MGVGNIGTLNLKRSDERLIGNVNNCNNVIVFGNIYGNINNCSTVIMINGAVEGNIKNCNNVSGLLASTRDINEFKEAHGIP